ncbi:sigma factor-like helix-turn-helix DNA-binding protein [Guptibacillus algicola]|uniref:sigma factor-like helix-turn-helix DNA-binding protein n=1 Tax=Guptibacillus algicola TaxID=225844 RepID=UPI001CD717FF|nr:sigma factor-like helix-turn-helix DNA-binding protein [Alkalihalobacillus algicola]MCA0987170.1 hypothetical protein [Alkalihalobacillus algicola]
MEKRFTSMNHEGISTDERLEILLPKLYSYCMFLTKDRWLGEDLAHDAVVKAYKNYEESKLTSALLKKIAYHSWIDHVRRNEKESLVTGEGISSLTRDEIECDEDLVEKLVGALTSKQLMTFVLKEAFQYKISEIAQMLEMSETGVKALLNRARSRVRSMSTSSESNPLEVDVVLYRSLVRAIAIQDPTGLITLIPTLIPKAITPSRPSTPSMILLSAA